MTVNATKIQKTCKHLKYTCFIIYIYAYICVHLFVRGQNLNARGLRQPKTLLTLNTRYRINMQLCITLRYHHAYTHIYIYI